MRMCDYTLLHRMFYFNHYIELLMLPLEERCEATKHAYLEDCDIWTIVTMKYALRSLYH